MNQLTTPSKHSRCPRRLVRNLAAVTILAAVSGCTIFDFIFGPLPGDSNSNTDLTLGISIVQPASAVSATPGVATVIQWADIADVAGTVVRITAQRRNNLNENTADPIELVGDGTPGSGRDAIADGDNDFYEWDITGVRVGQYVIIATIESPEGDTQTVMSTDEDRGTTGAINVTTALPVPTLTFTAPGATDESVTTGNTFDITWTDNGATNADALVTLGLDTDDDHTSGNEIILVSNQALSESGNNGLFTFFFQDENGDTVPDGDYTVFAIVDDNANDIVTSEATGLLQVNP
ncbi:MAG: hypothetical protein H6819_03725 [Phycisphaerales bacterium]|nr:hypothetical protein [Phycisphaerales bacterium]MCB9856307.1 hypothetical protein [Phycisphaerales bacterium]MCB9863254.1 hypothetical protein [Phycisphaerales bacterium]